MSYKSKAEVSEGDIEIKDKFLEKVKSLPLKDRLKAALLFETFEELLNIHTVNKKFNDDEFEKYENKLAELTE